MVIVQGGGPPIIKRGATLFGDPDANQYLQISQPHSSRLQSLGSFIGCPNLDSSTPIREALDLRRSALRSITMMVCGFRLSVRYALHSDEVP